jgi:hypothetical protein
MDKDSVEGHGATGKLARDSETQRESKWLNVNVARWLLRNSLYQQTEFVYGIWTGTDFVDTP